MALIPEEEIDFLDEKGFDYELVQAEGAVHLIFHRFPFPRYVPQQAEMLIRLPAGYPQTAVDMFYTIPDVKLPSGAFPDRCDQHPAFGGKVWQQWSRHSSWRVGIDNIRTFLSAVMKEINKGI